MTWTCMAFAFRLLFGELEVTTCPHLVEAEYAEGGRRLAELVA